MLLYSGYTTAKNKKEAARIYLSKEYNNIDYENKEWVEEAYNYMMKEFIRLSLNGDVELEKYEKQDEVMTLIDEINEYCLEREILDGVSKIYIKANNNSYSMAGENDKYIKKALNKFGSERLMDLLTDEEKRNVYITINLSNLMVIPLEEIP